MNTGVFMRKYIQSSPIFYFTLLILLNSLSFGSFSQSTSFFISSDNSKKLNSHPIYYSPRYHFKGAYKTPWTSIGHNCRKTCLLNRWTGKALRCYSTC